MISISMAPARPSDAEAIFELSNDPVVRGMSFSSEPIPWEGHLAWFGARLADPACLFLVFRHGPDLVGQVRFAKRGDGEAEVGISLAAAYRGGGVAVGLMRRALAAVRERWGCDSVIASVKPGNAASNRYFAKCGYRLEALGSVSGQACNVFRYSFRGSNPMNSTLIVAELSANHGHKLSTALDTVRAAKEAGADAIKIQTYTADTITLDCDNEYFRISQGTIWDGTTLHKLYSEASTPWEWHKAISDAAREAGLLFFSTPFDPTAVDFLEDLEVPCYKIASFEITDLPLIEYVASKGKPMILSTGIATIGEIDEAVAACRRCGVDDITLLKCTSEYPAPIEEANLATMASMAQSFGVKVGLSDHTDGSSVALAAVALGAVLVEKHFILDRSIGGPDASFSMEPAAFRAMADGIREVERAIGTVSYNDPAKVSAQRAFSRSLFVVRDMKAGEAFDAGNVRSIRPGYGMPPKEIGKVLGRKARVDIARGTPLSPGLVD